MLKLSLSASIRLLFLTFALLVSAQFAEAQNTKPQTTVPPAKETPKPSETPALTDKKLTDPASTPAVKPKGKGRLPVIVIPGLIGSELLDKDGNKVWFNLRRAKDDDLRLPVSPDLKANKDSLVVGDILRKIKVISLAPKLDIYQKLIDSLEADGYTEGKMDSPADTGGADTFYVFPYDWRLDNVENAQLLIKKMDELRVNLKRPNLKFNVVAHSMGGLIARYAAMYGNADLTEIKPQPTWRGASYFNSISLIATPNAGATTSLNSLLKGFSLFGGGKLNLPFIQKITKFDLFTIPSVYQLLPHAGMIRAYDENLRPLKIDIYDPATWEKYGWAAYTDDDFNKNFEPAEQAQAKEYFRVVLLRAKEFQAALDAKPAVKNPIPTYYLGSECKKTIDGVILRQDSKDNRWITEFGAPSYKRSDGTKVSDKQTGKILLSPGDGVVSKSSLLFSYLKLGRLQNPRSGVLINDLTLSCDEHNRLTGNIAVDKNLMGILGSSIPETNPPSLVKPGSEGQTKRKAPVRVIRKRSARRN